MSLMSIVLSLAAASSIAVPFERAGHAPGMDGSPSEAAWAALERWRIHEAESRTARLPRGLGRVLLDGVIANPRGRIARSITLLRRAMPACSRRPDRHVVLAAMTLSDDYRKLARFAEELAVDRLILSRFAGLLDESQRTEMQERLATARVLEGSSPTTVSWSGPVRLAMTREVVGLWSVPVSREGVVSRWSLDTGANYSVVSESTARRLDLRILDGSTTTGTSTTRRVDVRYAIVPELSLGTATLHDLVVLVLADEALHAKGPDFEYQIAGLLGYNAFAALGSITFDRTGLFLARPGAPPLVGGGPLFMNGLSPVVEVSVEGRALPMGLDSGANRTTFYQPYAKLFGVEAATWARSRNRLAGAGGAVTTDMLRQPRVELRLAGRKATLSDIGVLTSSHDGNAERLFGNIGIDLVNEFASFTINFRTMQIGAEQAGVARSAGRGGLVSHVPRSAGHRSSAMAAAVSRAGSIDLPAIAAGGRNEGGAELTGHAVQPKRCRGACAT